jgi:alcohol dehydrogenase YqhD (iron-dependent ADH family)
VKNFTGFNFYLSTDILFGKDTENQAGKMIRKHGGTKVMLVYGGGSIKKNGLYDRVAASLKSENLPFVDFGGVHPNPRRSLVGKGVKIAFDEKVDFLLGIGGGSSIDTAKAIALALANNGEYWKFYNRTRPEKMAPVGTINTIAASGSETSRSSVLEDDIGTGQKQGFSSDPCRPIFAIMNPELTYTVSTYQTGAGSADTLAHTVSRYFIRNSPISRLGDEFAEGVMRTVVRYAPIAIAHPDDYEARAELMLAASFSHNDLTGIGRSAAWGDKGGEHELESQISGHYDTAHGAGLAAVMPAWLQYIADTGTPDQVARIAQFGVKVFGVNPDLEDVKATADAGLRAFKAWVASIGMPLTLKELGIPKEELDAIIKRCLDINGGKVQGFAELDEKAVRAIFTSILE